METLAVTLAEDHDNFSDKTYRFTNGAVLRIMIDPHASDPRKFDNLGRMICFHNKYRLGDKHEYHHDDYANWEELEAAIRKREDVAVIMPLYLYDHSGITIATHGFSYCDPMGWDWGQVGFVFVSKETVRKEYSVNRISRKVREKVIKALLAEVEVYNQYLQGEVYGFVLKHPDGEEDSCWGFYGSAIDENGILDNIPRIYAEALKRELHSNQSSLYLGYNP